jgi:hypothetical protein
MHCCEYPVVGRWRESLELVVMMENRAFDHMLGFMAQGG